MAELAHLLDWVTGAWERYAEECGIEPNSAHLRNFFQAGYISGGTAQAHSTEVEVRALREALGATWWVHDGKGVYWCGVCDGGELTLSPPPSPPWDERIAGIEHEPHCIVPRVLAPGPAEPGGG